MTQSVSSDRAQLGQLGPVLALRPSPRFQVESWTSAASPEKGFVSPPCTHLLLLSPLHPDISSAPRDLLSPSSSRWARVSLNHGQEPWHGRALCSVGHAATSSSPRGVP